MDLPQRSGDAEGGASKSLIEIDNPCVDISFKRVMDDQVFCCGFLSSVLGFQKNEITEVRKVDTQLLASKNLGTHLTSDFLCITRNNGTKILVEIQNNYNEAEYKAKAIVEIARVLARWDSERLHEHVAKKKKTNGGTASSAKSFWLDITATFVIVVTNGPTTEPYVVNQYKLLLDHSEEIPQQEQQPAQRPLGSIDVRVVIVSLDKFSKTEDELATVRDCYLYAFKLPPRPSKSALVSKQIMNIGKVTCGGDLGLEHFYGLLNTSNETSHVAFLKQWTEAEDYICKLDEAAREATNCSLLLKLFRQLQPTSSAAAVAASFNMSKADMQTALERAGIINAEDPQDIQYFKD